MLVKADAVVAVGSRLQHKYSRSLPNLTVEIVTPGIFQKFSRESKCAVPRSLKNFIVSLFGRATFEGLSLKGYDIVANAIGSLSNNFELTFVGSSPVEHQKVEQCRGRIEKRFPCNHEEALSCYKKNVADDVLMLDVKTTVRSRVSHANNPVPGVVLITSVVAFVEKNATGLDMMLRALKKLSCCHPCIGLCGENCPTVCPACHPKNFSSLLAGGRGKKMESTRYLQLWDCNRIVKVKEMDKWMDTQLDNDAQLIRRCPKCTVAITFSYRYARIIKRMLTDIDNVKVKVQELEREVEKSINLLGMDLLSLNYAVPSVLRSPSEGGRLARFIP
ncbi:NFX1-type zinc finger-containing protein 1 [Stylophora pistillata]|uniref:NFX1-type zinc finger-containing protein 1 n=1 Tax=Stylophora pistillata TaxID=50429 RepID=A0A2B4RDL3_STYPI|nr:NFX1-type zinc finger-containing protein 1 [Stylophora pistillata]